MTTCKLKKFSIIFLAAISAFILSFSVLHLNASASSVSVGSTLFTNSDNITISSKTSGLSLLSEGKADTSTEYARKLYFEQQGFSLNFNITSNNFKSLVFTFTEDYDKYDAYMGNLNKNDRKTVIKLTKTESGFDAGIEGQSVTAIQKSLSGSIRLGYNKTTGKFFVNSGNNADLNGTVSFYNDEAYLTIGFEGIEIGKEAEIIITDINTQNFASSVAGYANDNKAPIIRLNKALVQYSGENIAVEAPAFKSYTLPVYGLDIIASSIKFEIKTLYSADGNFSIEETSENTATFTTNTINLPKVGYYKIISMEANDNSGNSTSDCVDFDFSENDYIIHASVWNNTAPVITNFDNYLNAVNETYYNGGTDFSYKFKTPEVSVNSTPISITENPNLISYKLHYKLRTSSSWSVQDGLIFTAKTVGWYDFRIQALDRQGNYSEKSDIISLYFDDVTSPQILITGFSTEKYLNQEITLPSGTVTDDMDYSPKTTIKVYYLGENIAESTEETLITESYTFTPDKLGWYKVVYAAEDAKGNSTEAAPMSFKVIEVDEPMVSTPTVIDFDNVWNIVFLSIAGASALGLIILLFVKPKEDK